jgi:dipeptidyl-peptidase-4
MSQITQIQDFPLIYNQTQRATLGVPRSFQIIDDTSFLHLNKVDATGTLGIYISTLENNEIKESLLIDPSNLLDKDDVDIPDEIKALKERLRDLSSGISSFQYCAETDVLLFSLGSDVFLFSIRENRILKNLENVFLPLLSPNGKYIALCQSKDMKVFDISKDQYIKIISQDGYVWGQPDFISAEEMGRYVSIWFSPDSNKILSLGYSDENVELTQIQANKDEDAKDYKYPFAGTSNPKLLLNEYIIGGDSKFSEVNDEYYVNTEFIENESISISLNRDQNILSSNSESFEYKSNRHIDLFNTIPKCLKMPHGYIMTLIKN